MAKNSTNTYKNPPQKGRKIMPVLGVGIDSSQGGRLLEQACAHIPLGTNLQKNKGYFNSRQSFFITTPNPEIVTRATSDSKLLSCLNASDMVVPDAIGIAAALKYLSLPKPKHIALKVPVALAQGLLVGSGIIFYRKWVTSETEVLPGRVFMEELVSYAAQKGNPRIFLLGGKSGSATLAAKVLSKRYDIREIKSDAGPWLDMKGIPATPDDNRLEKEVIEIINEYKPQLLFVALGAPKQEKWIARNLPQLKAGIIMTVGGAFDYIAGINPEPPKIMSQMGFEWLWRLITQPERVGRIFTAVVVFPWKVFLSSLKD